MRNLITKPELDTKNFDKSFLKLVSFIIFSGVAGLLYYDLVYQNAFAQTLQELCTPDRGINTSQSNCFSNAPVQPTYNMTTTDNARPPSEIGPTYANNTTN